MTPDQIRVAISASQALLALMPDTQAIASALSVGRTRMVEVEAWRAQRYFVKRLKWRAIVAASTNASHPAMLAAQVAVDLAENPAMTVDFTDAAAAGMWSALTQTNLCTTADRDEIQSWCIAPNPVDEFAVRCAIYADDGTLKV